MRTFAYSDVDAASCGAACSALLEAVAADQARMEAVRREYPGLLASLADRAFFENVDASARIEGIYAEPERVRALIAGETPEGDREQQIAGYSRTLRALTQSPEFFTISTSTLLAMHTVLFTGRAFDTRSRYRRKDYQDVVDAEGRVQRIPVSPINAFETPLYLGSLCDSLAAAFADAGEAQLLLIPRFCVDFLCVRPFGEGNGRLVRLFMHLLLQAAGIDIAQYASIDRRCEADAMGYYDALNACVEGWDASANSYEPFTRYWLGKVHEAYGELFSRVELDGGAAPSKTERVRLYFDRHVGRCTKQDIAAENPDISISTIENALRDLVRSEYIRMVGSGRGAAYQRNDSL